MRETSTNYSLNPVGVGTRVINFLIDTTIIALAAYGIYHAVKWYAIYWQTIFIPYYIIFWAIQFIYYFLFEGFIAMSPGKMLTYSVVVKNDGEKPGWLAVLLRSLVRLIIIDCFFFPFLKERTLHDYLSSTKVVQRR